MYPFDLVLVSEAVQNTNGRSFCHLTALQGFDVCHLVMSRRPACSPPLCPPQSLFSLAVLAVLRCLPPFLPESCDSETREGTALPFVFLVLLQPAQMAFMVWSAGSRASASTEPVVIPPQDAARALRAGLAPNVTRVC